MDQRLLETKQAQNINISQRKKAAIQVVVLFLICVLITWHVVYWHLSGIHLEMFQWLHTGRACITVLYNLGLMLVLGITLGSLMERTTDVISYKASEQSKK
ncbi:MAG: hypothetical protein KAV87_15795 [Desulfobacteraceae bacterium]|nr:hypothetical protein [Desulfobacteraceae bacterium]